MAHRISDRVHGRGTCPSRFFRGRNTAGGSHTIRPSGWGAPNEAGSALPDSLDPAGPSSTCVAGRALLRKLSRPGATLCAVPVRLRRQVPFRGG